MKNLTIQNYKCLEKVELAGLQRVNLFTGKNNTGKTSILEAIGLFFTEGEFGFIVDLLKSRGVLGSANWDSEDYEDNRSLFNSFFYKNSKEENLIQIFHETKCLRLSIKKQSEANDMQNFHVDFEPHPELSNVAARWLIIEIQNSFARNARLFKRKVDNLYFVNAKGENLVDNSILFDEIVIKRKKDWVIDGLKIIDFKVIDLEYVNASEVGKRMPVVGLEYADRMQFLKTMGDGINRILSIILALVNAENGVLLIDEFENGLHYSVQEKLWEIIFELSAKLNVQVFATTHSNDSIESFAKVLEKRPEKDEGALFRLHREEDEIQAFNFSEEEIINAARQHINLR